MCAFIVASGLRSLEVNGHLSIIEFMIVVCDDAARRVVEYLPVVMDRLRITCRGLLRTGIFDGAKSPQIPRYKLAVKNLPFVTKSLIRHVGCNVQVVLFVHL
jgi:hypothetical protein